jgi:transketolase
MGKATGDGMSAATQARRQDTQAADGGAGMDLLAINTIRTLAMDAVQKAKSGHPGTPMGLAPVAYTLWQNHLRYDPADPTWPGRDRFVLSVGHASMLLYALIHLAGVRRLGKDGPTNEEAISLDDIKQFRQLSSVTPGHPEYTHTTGVETTTGPLGQGCANSVGMAMAQRWFAARYDRPGFALYDYRVWVLCGDGDMMEGVSSEAASMAAHLGLSNLCWIYDSNTITIEGSTGLAFSEDVGRRFEAYGWRVLHVRDANDTQAVDEALSAAQAETEKPTFILIHSVIGYGAPHKAGTREAHGEPLGEEEIKGAKRAYGWPEDAQFLVPDGVRERFAEGVGARGAKLRAEWMTLYGQYRAQHPDLARELDEISHHALPEGWDKDVPVFPADAKGLATRDSSQKVLNAIAQRVPWLIGGAADLAPSTKSNLTFEGAGSFEADNPAGRNMHFGIREHAMGSVCNGLALSGVRAYGSGFLIFMDYMKPPIRLAAIMELPVIYIFTHDSVGVGEDGPTHQPIEQLATLRSTPGLCTMRPADANEVAEAWRVAMLETKRPTALALSRQALPTFDRSKLGAASGVARGAYVLADTDGQPDVILMGTGSEVALCMQARDKLAGEGIKARVVSMPSWDLFERQDDAYRDSVIPKAVRARVAVEMASPLGWDRYAGVDGKIVAMHGFGASAPAAALAAKFGFSVDKIADAAREQVEKAKSQG